jgi:hypothetical protein
MKFKALLLKKFYIGKFLRARLMRLKRGLASPNRLQPSSSLLPGEASNQKATTVRRPQEKKPLKMKPQVRWPPVRQWQPLVRWPSVWQWQPLVRWPPVRQWQPLASLPLEEKLLVRWPLEMLNLDRCPLWGSLDRCPL